MSKYRKLWDYLKNNCLSNETLTFDEIYSICGARVDGNFVDCKDELAKYGISIVKFSLRDRTVHFSRSA